MVMYLAIVGPPNIAHSYRKSPSSFFLVFLFKNMDQSSSIGFRENIIR